MARFVQPLPDLGDPYPTDQVLHGFLGRLLGPYQYRCAAPLLAELGAAVPAELRSAHLDAEEHPPRLQRYDGWGTRIDRIHTAPGWQTLRAAAARHALVALPYQTWARDAFGRGARLVQLALLHLYGPESAVFTCPVAMSDGAAALLIRPEVDPAVRDAWLPRLLSTDPDSTITSGQWMTESQGGSDLSGTQTQARLDPAGTWRLTGEKWFCSAADSAVAVALTRPDGAGPGSRVLAPFLVPRYLDQANSGSPAAGLRLHRLKQKLGTRAVPTAEVGLTDVVAYPLGDPAQPGLSRMMTLVVVTRLHNTAAAAAGMRRGLDYALRFAQVRQVGGQPLLGNPLHRATLGSLEADAQAAFALAAHAFGLLGRVEVDHDTAAEAELRLVAPLAKLVTGKLAVASAAEYLECFGGAGYLEDTGLARLLRDAQVLPIWEGTTNVLSVDVLRAIAHGEGSAQVLARIEDAGQRLTGAPAKRLSDYLAGLRERIAGAGSNPRSAAVQAGARELALDLGHALAAALLVEQATEPAAELDTAGGHPADHDSARATLASSVWLRSRLFHEATADIAGELVTPPRHS